MRSGKLVALSLTEKRVGKAVVWLARCDCGNTRLVPAGQLSFGQARSCGCVKNPGSSTHRASCTPTYNSWRAMRGRVNDVSNSHFHNYGGRGISICPEWGDFATFLKDMGERPPGTSIERKDNDGDYCPQNCFWATAKQQSRNTSRTRFVTFAGESAPLVEWAERLGITQSALSRRLDRWPFEVAMTAPHNFTYNSARFRGRLKTKE